MGGVGDEDTYLAKDPFALAGRSVGSWNMPAPRNNAEALWMPALQGGLMGALGGYGRSQAQQAQYVDMQSLLNSPTLLEAFGDNPELAAMVAGSDRPDNFSPKALKNELLLAALTQQKEDKKQELQDELKAKIDLATNPEIIDAEVDKQNRINKGTKANPFAKELLEEGKGILKSEKEDEAISNLFSQAKNIDRIKGALAIPGTSLKSSEAATLEGINANLQLMVQKKLGAEPSDKVRSRVDNLIVDFNDSDAEVDRKEKGMKELFKNMSDVTPLTEALGGTKKLSTGMEDSPKYEIRTGPDGKRYKVILGQ